MDVHSRAKCSNLILRIAYQRFFSSSFIQTILSASESHRIIPYGSRALPPVGTYTLP